MISIDKSMELNYAGFPAFSVPLPIVHVDGTVPFPDSIRKRDGLRIGRYPIKRGYFVVRPNLQG